MTNTFSSRRRSLIMGARWRGAGVMARTTDPPQRRCLSANSNLLGRAVSRADLWVRRPLHGRHCAEITDQITCGECIESLSRLRFA